MKLMSRASVGHAAVLCAWVIYLTLSILYDFYFCSSLFVRGIYEASEDYELCDVDASTRMNFSRNRFCHIMYNHLDIYL